MPMRFWRPAATSARKALPDCGEALFARVTWVKCLEGVWGVGEKGGTKTLNYFLEGLKLSVHFIQVRLYTVLLL